MSNNKLTNDGKFDAPQIFQRLLKDGKVDDATLAAAQQYISGGTENSSAKPLLRIVEAMNVARTRCQTTNLVVNLACGMAYNAAWIVGGPKEAKIVRSVTMDKDNVRTMQTNSFLAAVVIGEALCLPNKEDFWNFCASDLSNSFLEILRQGDDTVSKLMRTHLTPSAIESLRKGGAEAKNSIASEFNTLFRQKLFYDQAQFSQVKLTANLREMLDPAPTPDQFPKINRLLLECAYRKDLSRRVAILNYLKSHLESRQGDHFSLGLNWLAEHNIQTCEALRKEAGLNSPNEMTVARAAKQAKNCYEKFSAPARGEFCDSLIKYIPELAPPWTTKEVITQTREILANGPDTDRHELVSELTELVRPNINALILNVSLAEQIQTLSPQEREQLLAPWLASEQTFEKWAAQGPGFLSKVPDVERSQKLQALRPLVTFFAPEELLSILRAAIVEAIANLPETKRTGQAQLFVEELKKFGGAKTVPKLPRLTPKNLKPNNATQTDQSQPTPIPQDSPVPPQPKRLNQPPKIIEPPEPLLL